jgi:hypothetical protein
MAVAAFCGFEGQALKVDGVNVSFIGTAAYDTGTVRTGAASMRANPASGAGGYFSNLAGAVAYMHFAVRFASLPSVNRVFTSGVAAGMIHAEITSTGTISVYLNTTLIGTSSTALSTNTWYWIGLRQVTGTSVDFLQIDGVSAVTGTATVTLSDPSVGFVGTEASAVDAYFDDVIFDDAGLLAPSKVDTALPISDNTRTNVTAGAGGTTNLWDAVNNTPPAGVASASETNTSNIEYPASLTESYIANLETYTTLGIGASDTVLAVRSIVRHGEDIATGTKNLQNVGALTNPTVGGSSVTAGSDGGAHGAEIGLWVSTFGTLTTSPSVTLGTSPTIRTSRISEARVACIDFMGMLVAWTPAAGGGATSLLPPSITRRAYAGLLPR